MFLLVFIMAIKCQSLLLLICILDFMFLLFTAKYNLAKYEFFCEIFIEFSLKNTADRTETWNRKFA